jgi:hypothetical protein
VGGLVKGVISDYVMIVRAFIAICFISKLDYVGGCFTFFVDDAVTLMTQDKRVSCSNWSAAACTIFRLNNTAHTIGCHLEGA